MSQDPQPSLTRYLPSAGGVALWFYALAFVILPALLAYKGWVYILGTVLFAVGIRPHVEAAIEGRKVWFGYRSKRRAFGRHVTFKMGESFAVKLTGWGLILLTLLGVPIVAFIIQQQGQTFITQFEERLPVILDAMRGLLGAAHDRLPTVFPEIDANGGSGWSGLSSLVTDTFGDVATEFKDSAKVYAKDGIKLVGVLLADWVKLVISAIIIGTLIGNWKKEVAMHRDVISRGIAEPQLRANVLRYGELFQEGISLFMIGYLEVAVTLSFIYVIGMVALPLGLGFGTILFMAVVLGFVTAIPKIGGLLSMFLAFFLMFTNIQPGLGWFGYDVVSFGWGWDVVIRTAIMMVIAKLMGFLEAYNFTPEIIGARLGMTKVQIIAVILIWAVGAGFFGMIWGILISLGFQAALRLSQELDAAKIAAATSAVKAAE
jgi:predicted PurR-regulated permease PerM